MFAWKRKDAAEGVVVAPEERLPWPQTAALGVVFTILLTGALMGLNFLSHGTGHDDAIIDPMAEDDR